MSLLSSYSFPSATSSPLCLYRDVILAISPSVLIHAPTANAFESIVFGTQLYFASANWLLKCACQWEDNLLEVATAARPNGTLAQARMPTS